MPLEPVGQSEVEVWKNGEKQGTRSLESGDAVEVSTPTGYFSDSLTFDDEDGGRKRFFVDAGIPGTVKVDYRLYDYYTVDVVKLQIDGSDEVVSDYHALSDNDPITGTWQWRASSVAVNWGTSPGANHASGGEWSISGTFTPDVTVETR